MFDWLGKKKRESRSLRWERLYYGMTPLDGLADAPVSRTIAPLNLAAFAMPFMKDSSDRSIASLKTPPRWSRVSTYERITDKGEVVRMCARS